MMRLVLPRRPASSTRSSRLWRTRALISRISAAFRRCERAADTPAASSNGCPTFTRELEPTLGDWSVVRIHMLSLNYPRVGPQARARFTTTTTIERQHS